MAVTTLEKLVTYYRENKISHAYLLETNNIQKCFADLSIVIKQIFCQKEYQEDCHECNICNLINQNYLPSLVVIEPDGANIKKEQVLELKRAFSMMPVYTTENIYIVKETEKLNGASANTILKFVEEPEEHIIGFFITNNANNCLPTIKSRCEVLKVMYDVDALSLDTLDNEENKEHYKIALEYISKLEVEKNKSIMYNRDILLSKLTDKEDIIKVFKIMLIIYECALDKKLNLNANLTRFNDLDYLLKLSYEELSKRVNLITQFLDDITYNVNKELLLDKFVIELGEMV